MGRTPLTSVCQWGAQVFIALHIPLSLLTQRATLLLEDTGVAPLMATRVEESPLFPAVVIGLVAARAKSPVRHILHHTRDHGHIWGEKLKKR